MEWLMTFWDNNHIIVTAAIAFLVVYIVFMIIYMSRKKQRNNEFLQKYPNAACIYIDGPGAQSMNTILVDGLKATFFTNGTRFGFYLLPGEHVITDTKGAIAKINAVVQPQKLYVIEIRETPAHAVFKAIQRPEFGKYIVNPPARADEYAVITNQIEIDSIDDKSIDFFHWEYGTEKKGLLAGKTELVYLLPGSYKILAHGKTYQTIPAIINVTVEKGVSYELGSWKDESGNDALYFMKSV